MSNAGTYAATGAAIGTVIPGVGNAVGGAVGGAVGALSSLFGGDSEPKPSYASCPGQPTQEFAGFAQRASAAEWGEFAAAWAAANSSPVSRNSDPATVARAIMGGSDCRVGSTAGRELQAVARRLGIVEGSTRWTDSNGYWDELTQPAAAAPVAPAPAVVPRSTAGSPLEGAGPQLATALWVGGGVVAVLLLLLFLGVRS